MVKYKLKPKYKKTFSIVGIIILVLALILGTFFYIQYRNSNYYKLTVLGYSKEESKDITKNYSESLQTKILKEKFDKDILTIIKKKYFIENNFKRYLEYNKSHSKESLENVIILVNVNRDKEVYEDTKTTNVDKSKEMIINKYYHLDKNYIPKNLIKLSTWYTYGNLEGEKGSYNAFLKMFKAAKDDKITLVINSAYRAYEKQNKIYKEYQSSHGEEYAEKYAARPGYSEHQTGLAYDIVTPSHTTKDNFDKSDAFKWLLDNSYKYGFILRYPKDKENITGFSYESWHYRYVGVKAATKCHKEKITYDEYYAYYIENKK